MGCSFLRAINILVKAWFVTFKILLFSSKNEHQLLQSAWGIAQRVRFTAMRSALCYALSEIDYTFKKNCLGDSYILTLNEYIYDSRVYLKALG